MTKTCKKLFQEGLLLVLMLLMFTAVLALCAWMYPTMTAVKKMDCSLVEFSPDVTLEVKKACRDARNKI